MVIINIGSGHIMANIFRGMDIKTKITISTCERRREKEVMCVDLKFARIKIKNINTRYIIF